MSTKSKQLTQEQKMMQGTAWLTIGDFLSKLLGAIYIIPWYTWMGKHAAEANALFTMGYNIYGTILLISTSGINIALSKQIAKYNTLGQTEHTAALVRNFLKLMLLSGVFFSLLLYLGAPIISRATGVQDDLIPVLYSLCFSVLVFPAMSAIRGIFQGYTNMKPFAISQVMEQIIRVIWMLLTAFFIMNIGSGDFKAAVTQSTFAAFLGMVASLGVLFYFLWKEDLLWLILKPKKQDVVTDYKPIIIETIKEAIPFIITGSAIQTFQIIDQLTFINAMSLFTSIKYEKLLVLFSYLSANPNKIIMILISVAASIGGMGIPLITENFVKKDRSAMARLVINNLQMLFFFLLPAISGAILLYKPLYTIFYPVTDNIAFGLFVVTLLQALLLASYTVLSPMLQALFESKKAIKYFSLGLATKLVIQLPMIYIFQAYGPLIATSIALAVPIVLMYRKIYQVIHFNRNIIRKSSLLVTLLTLIMLIAIIPVTVLLNHFLPANTRILSFIHLAIVGSLGISVYAYLSLKTRYADKFLGIKAQQFRDKARIS